MPAAPVLGFFRGPATGAKGGRLSGGGAVPVRIPMMPGGRPPRPPVPPQIPMGPWDLPPIAPAAAVPLIPLAAAFLAGAATNLAVQALWGYLNSRLKKKQDLANGTRYDWPTPRTVAVTGSWNDTGYSQKWCTTNANAGNVPSANGAINSSYNNVVGLTLEGIGSYSYNFDCGVENLVNTIAAAGNFHLSNGSTTRVVWRSLKSGTGKLLGSPRPYSTGSPSNGAIVTGVTAGGVPFVLPDIADPAFAPPSFDPEAEPLADPVIQPTLPKRPPVAPPDTAVPDGEPLPPTGDPGTGPGTGAGTSTRTRQLGLLLPLRPPSVIPLPPGDPTAPDITIGSPKRPKADLPAPVTDPGTEVTPDGVIGQPGTPPPPTLDGIAAEVGKIEQKTRQLLNRPQLSLEDLLAAIEDLLGDEAEPDPYPAGSYLLLPVCEDKDPAVANWQAGEGQLNLLNAKLDALAELLQAHKDFRQPICATKASGQPVTVQFQEIG